jgi:hypothetical protein
MTEPIHLTGREPLVGKLAAAAGYRGRNITLVPTESVDVTRGAYWSDGNTSEYTLIRLSDLARLELPSVRPPRVGEPHAEPVPLSPGFACLELSYAGTRKYLRIHVHPQGIAPGLLPPKQELSEDEQTVLHATRSLKSSYAGIRNYRLHEAHRATGITRARWEAAKAALIERKLLNKAGAITPAGRNAVGNQGWPARKEVA